MHSYVGTVRGFKLRVAARSASAAKAAFAQLAMLSDEQLAKHAAEDL